MAGNHDNDLPLMANSRDFHLFHYLLDLTCSFDTKVFSGSITLFLNRAGDHSPNNLQVFSMQEYQSQMTEFCQKLEAECNRKKVSVTLAPIGKETEPSVNKRRINPSEAPTAASVGKYAKLSMDGHHTLVDSKSPVEDESSQASTDLDMESQQMTPRSLTANTAAAAAVAVGRVEEQESRVRLLLDACDLEVSSVDEVDVQPEELLRVARWSSESQPASADPWAIVSDAPCRSLCYSVSKWCLSVWKEGVMLPGQFPRVVRIWYRTKAEGPSLRWTQDQDERPCVFTAAMWVNNRALFPTAEFGNLSTWQCRIRAPGGAAVLMSSDEAGRSTARDGETMVEWRHHCTVPLPPFTLAIAVGFWPHVVLADECPSSSDENPPPVVTCDHQPRCGARYAGRAVLPARLFGPASLLPRAERVLRPYWPGCSRAVQELLGACPFHRMDLLIYPACVQDMALSNPNLIFLSQSLLAADGSMNMRVAHELSHAWFGLLIGARDWTEEWLSEGFATFMEDSIHARALGLPECQEIHNGELRALIRHKVLQAEMENTQNQLQTLRPDPCHEFRDEETSVLYVKNGLNPNKQFTQVHYLKGYFLLRHLARIIGPRKFNAGLKSYIRRFHGQMVLSKDFLNHIFEVFPELSENGLSIDSIFSQWLDVPGMPVGIESLSASEDNALFSQVEEQAKRWKKLETDRTQRRRSNSILQCNFTPQMAPEQLVLLLEELLATMPAISSTTLRRLKQTYNLTTQNADVRHRWCELVVKHRYKAAYDDVRDFLLHDQAMGVYLYGELVLSRSLPQRRLAEECFQRVAPHMEKGTRDVVNAMLYGDGS